MEVEFDSLELFYLRRVVMLRLEVLSSKLERYRRYSRDVDREIIYQNDIANLEVEIKCLENVKECINMQIAKNEIKKIDK